MRGRKSCMGRYRCGYRRRGGGGAVQAFVARRRVSQADKPREYWVGVLGQDWARVELERVEDASLGNPMERRAS